MRTLLPPDGGWARPMLLILLPLALSLARRVDRGQQQMQRLMVNAVESSDLERRRIAQDLHDGVVQDLAGIGYALDPEARRLPEGGGMRERLEQTADILRRDLATVRTLMTDIYPPDLDQGGLPGHPDARHGCATGIVVQRGDRRSARRGRRPTPPFSATGSCVRPGQRARHAGAIRTRVARRSRTATCHRRDRRRCGLRPHRTVPRGPLRAASAAGHRQARRREPGVRRRTGELR